MERDAELTALVESLAAEHHVPGLAVGVIADGLRLVSTVGVTSTTDPLPVDEHTLFMIGSTSKTVTATAVMALVDQGRLSLQDRVIDHLPDFTLQDEEVARTVTVEQLLNHTSGWRGDVTPTTGWGDDALGRAVAELVEAPQVLPPGQLASYSNGGFLVAGHLVAQVCGTGFETAVQELVLTPLAMSKSFYLPWEIAWRRHAVGHVVTDGAATPATTYPVMRSLGPAGGLWSSVGDQLRWAAYHLDGTTAGTAPLQEPTRLLMQRPTVHLRSGVDGIGLSWLLKRHGDAQLVTHGGNVSNLQTSAFALAPAHGVAVVVLTGTSAGATIGDTVLAWALQRWAGVGPQAPLPTVPFVPEELVGMYDLGPFAHRLTVLDGRLYLDLALTQEVPEEVRLAFAKPPRELVAVAPDVFALASDPSAAVLDVRRSADGTVAGVVSGMRFAPRS